MGEAWKELDLGGEGLQSANIRLAGLLKRRGRAYALLALFPLGLHRDYLDDRRMGWVFRALTGAALVSLALGPTWVAAGFATALALLALHDLRWIDDRVAALNKALRRKVYLSQGKGAPPGYRGRYTDAGLGDTLHEQETERPGNLPPAGEALQDPRRRAPSFAEQEALLREIERRKRGESS